MVPSTPPTPYKSSIVSTGKGGSTLGAPSLAGEFSTLLSRLTRTSSKSGVSDATSPTYGQSREAVPSAPRGNEKPLAQDKPAAAASSQPPPDGTTSGQAAEPRLPLAPSKAALASSQSLQPMPVPTLLSSPAPTLLNSPASAAGHVDLAPQDPDVLPKTQAATAGQGSPEDPGKGGSSTGQSSNSIPKVNVSAGGDAALGEVRLGGPASESSGSTSTTVSNAGGKSPGDGNGGPLPKDKLEGGGGDSSKTQGGRTNKAQVGTAPLEQQNGRVTPNKDAEQGGLAQGKAAGGTGGDGSKSSGVDSKSDNSKGTSSVKSGDDANINNDSTSGNGEGKTAGTDVESGGGDTGSVNSVEDANNEQELDLAPLPLDANVNPGPDQQGTRPAKGAKGDPVEQSDSRSDAAVPAKEDEDAADPVNVAEEPVNIEEGGATEPKDTASEPSEAAPEDPALAPPEAEGAVAGSSESPLDEVDLQPDALEPPAGENADEPAGPIPGPQAQTDDPDHSVDEVDLQPADTPELEPIDTPSAEPAVEPEEIDIEGPSESPEAAGQDVEPEAEAPDAEPDTLDEAAPEEAELQDANGVVLLPGDEAATASLDVAADPPAAEDDGESDGEGIDPPEAEDGEAPDENDMPPDTSSDPVEAPGETAEPASPDEAEVPIPDEDEAPAPAEEAESSEIPEPADELAPVPPPPPAPLVFMVGAFTHDLAAALCPLAAITVGTNLIAFLPVLAKAILFPRAITRLQPLH